MDFKKGIIILLSLILVKGLSTYYENKKNEHREAQIEIKTTPLAVASNGLESIKVKAAAEAKLADAKQVTVQIDWKNKVSEIKAKVYREDFELTNEISDNINRMMLDNNLAYDLKMKYRKELEMFEYHTKTEKFPDRQIVGFKKELIDPANPNSGYHLEPEFQ